MLQTLPPQKSSLAAAPKSTELIQDRVRNHILPPLIVAILTLQGIFIFAFFAQQRHNLEREEQNTTEYVNKVLQEEIAAALGKMDTAKAAIIRDTALTESLQTLDVAALKTQSQSLFEELRDEQKITHFYYHRPDRKVALRLHSDLKGDLNERTTILQAEATGQPHAGLEQGKTGNAVLRSVTPWWQPNPVSLPNGTAAPSKLLGYLELGMEFEDILQRVAQISGTQLVLAVDKAYLDRDLWEAKASALGIESEWDQFPQFVITNNTLGALPPSVQQVLSSAHQAEAQRSLQYLQGNEQYQAIFVPFMNVEGETLGYVIAFKEITQVVRPARIALMLAIACAALVSLGLIGLFYILLGRVQGNLYRKQHALITVNENLAQMVAHVASTAQALATRSQQMNQGAAQLLSGATHQAIATEEASTSISHMVSKIRDNTASANQTEAIAQTAAANAEGTRAAMLAAIQVMDSIVQQISVIEEIALQTNMLALNAGIEATRSQTTESGLGVIATEIRRLAERAQAAAAHVNQLATNSVQHVQQAETMINKLVPSIQTTAALVHAISLSSHEQLSSSTQIDLAIQQLDAVTQQNSSSAQELSYSAEDLARQAADLKQAIAAIHIYQDAG